MAESVLVVPRKFLFPPHHGSVQGFVEGTGEALLRLVREHGSFAPREEAEGDPSRKQIIPYAVIVSGRRAVQDFFKLFEEVQWAYEANLVGKRRSRTGNFLN